MLFLTDICMTSRPTFREVGQLANSSAHQMTPRCRGTASEVLAADRGLTVEVLHAYLDNRVRTGSAVRA